MNRENRDGQNRNAHINRRALIRALLQLPLVALAIPSWARALTGAGAAEAPATRTGAGSAEFRFAFGSCCAQDNAQPIWSAIERAKPNVFAFIGDNIYADTDDMNEMRAKYERLAANPDFALFRGKVPVIATWDDHDFGFNDCGAEYPKKHESKKLMLDFFGEPATGPRRERDGVYTSYFYGEAPHRVQVILLDLRWFRTSLVSDANGYAPNPDPAATMLGEEQWRWLDEQLALPADARIIASSIQFTSPIHGWEKWANFPLEKARLLAALDAHAVENTVIVSGDMHFAELSTEKTPGGREIHDLTSSGLNYFEPADGIANPNRVALADRECNFGMVTFHWNGRRTGSPRGAQPTVKLEARGLRGDVLFSRTLPLR